MNINDIKELKGLTIKDVFQSTHDDSRVTIFFSNEKTYLTLKEQDYYEYHDCSKDARHITICLNDPIEWKRLYDLHIKRIDW